MAVFVITLVIYLLPSRRAEIRPLILRHALHEEEIIIQYDRNTFRVTSNACGEVLRTCQQLRDEGTSILCSENVLSMSARDAHTFIHRFLPSIGPNNVSMIQHIKFHVNLSHLTSPVVARKGLERASPSTKGLSSRAEVHRDFRKDPPGPTTQTCAEGRAKESP